MEPPPIGIKEVVREELVAEASAGVRAGAEEDMAHRRSINIAPHQRSAYTAEEIHSCYLFVFELDAEPQRREKPRWWCSRVRQVRAAYQAAKADEATNTEEIPVEALPRMEEWIAEVAATLDREQESALAECWILLS